MASQCTHTILPSNLMVPAVDRALNLLELLGSTATGLSLSAISRRLDIPKSSAYYLVTTLAKHNLVQRSPGRPVYSLGTDAVHFATMGRADCALKALCAPYIRFLSNRLRMTAQVGIREGAEARIIDRSEIPGLKLDSWIGRHFDLHCTAVGKALISCLTRTEVENLFRSRGFPRHNENTIGSLEALRVDLEQVRRRGFATDDEEHELGVRCVASPIFNYWGGVVAALCVFSPSCRLSRSEMPNVGIEVTEAAKEISRHFNDAPSPRLKLA